jgi:hypothetical protein
MKSVLAISILVVAASSLLATEQDDPRFAHWMEKSREAFAKNHLIVDVKLESLEGKPHSEECRYDRYPGKVERIQLSSGLSYARKNGKKWIESDDWGESGKPVKKEEIAQLDNWVAWANVPLRKETPETRDKSQGAIVVRLVDQTTTPDGDEEFVFEQGRENQTGVNYPRSTFLKYKNSKPEDAILYKYSGPVYTAGGRVRVNLQFGLMIAVKMEMVTPTPSAPDKNASDEKAAEPTKERSATLPPPVSDKIYTFEQIEKQKAELKDKVVRIEIMKLVAGPGDLLGDGTHRYIVEDTSKGATPYGQVAFPREGLEKMGLANDPPREGPFIVYARVHVFPEKKTAAICFVVGTHVAVENAKATYSW